MRNGLFKIVGVLAVLVVLELGTRGCVDRVASNSIASKTSRVGSVSVAAGDPPAIFHFGILGTLANGSMTMHNIVTSPTNIAALSVSSAKLKISRLKLLGGTVKVGGSAPYTIEVVLSPKNLGDYLGTNVTMQGGYLQATIDTHPMDVQPKLKGRTIVLADERHTYKVPLPGREYLPCTPTGLGVGGGIAVSCQSDELPKVFSDALG